MMRDLSRRQYVSAISSVLIILSLGLAACQSGEGRRVTASEAGNLLPEPDPTSPVELVWQADGGPTRLRLPTGLTVDRHGMVTVIDAGNDGLVQLDSLTGQIVARLGRQGTLPGFRFTAPPNIADGDSGLVAGGVAADAAGSLFVADTWNGRIQRLDRAGRTNATWVDVEPGGSGQHPVEVFESVTAARLARPAGIAVDRQTGWIYVIDRATHRIHAFDCDGRWQLAWGQPGTAPGQFRDPMAVAVDRQGQIFVADLGNHRIQKFDNGGQFLAAWGGPGDQPGEFMAPVGVAVGPTGHVYVVDGGRVQVFTDTGIAVGAWHNAHPNATTFHAAGIAVDDQGAIYITDRIGHRVVKFRPRQPWPAPVAARPTPRPTVTIPTPAPPMPSPVSAKMTPTDR